MQPGIYNLSFAEYVAIEAVNLSTLKHIDDSPEAYRFYLSHERDDSDALRVGRYLHSALFEPSNLERDFAVWDGGRRSGAEWSAYVLTNTGRSILKRDQVEHVGAVAAKVRAYPPAAAILSSGVAESAIVWNDRETGMLCKGRVDWHDVGRGIMAELKFVRSVNGRKFGSQSSELGWREQLAFYSDGLDACGFTMREWAFITAGKEPHCPISVKEVSAGEVLNGQAQYRDWLRQLKYCQAHNDWPNQDNDQAVPYEHHTAWAKRTDEDEQLENVEAAE